MIHIFNNIVSQSEIQTLLDYYNIDDNRTEIRPDVRSKHPRWGVDPWCEELVRDILNRVLDEPWFPEDTLFLDSHMQGQGFRLHVDSGKEDSKLYRNVLIPIFKDGDAATMIFDNHWYGTSTRFSKTPISPFTYPLESINGIVTVNDIRVLLEDCKNNPKKVTDFVIDKKFIKDLESLVESRSGKKLGTVDNRTSDYTKITNYDENLRFDESIHRQYISHIPIETLHGLTVDKIYNWEIGSVLTFPRTQLHCATSTHSRKIGVSVFTNYES